MRVPILGTVQSVNVREYVRKDGTNGVAHNVLFESNGYFLEDNFYMGEAEWETMNIKPGVIGTMVVNLENKDKATRDGGTFRVKEWRFVDFRMANAQAQPQEQPQPAPAPQSKPEVVEVGDESKLPY